MYFSSKVKSFLGVVAVSLLASLTYNNCSPKHTNNGSSSSLIGTSFWSCSDQLDNLTLFSRTYHPFLMNRCANCHAGGGEGPGAFASSGVQLAFDSFGSRGFSLVNSRALDGHNPASGSQNSSEIDLITAQYVDGLETIERCRTTGEGDLTQDQDDPNRLKTISRPINPNANNPVTVTWNVQSDIAAQTGFNPADFTGVTLRADIEIFQRPGVFAYVISNPRLSTTAFDVRISSLLFKVNGKASPAQRAFYYTTKDVRAWNASNPDFNVPNARFNNDLISGGALVILGEVRTTDVISVSIGGIQRIVIPPPELGPSISFDTAQMSVTENYQIVDIPLTLSKPSNNPTSAEITFGIDTTIKDQCCRTTLNNDDQTINVSHFDRDIQDYDIDPLLPMNNRLQFDGVNARGRYLVTFGIGVTSKVLRIKIVHDNRVEQNEILHLRIDSTRLNGLNADATLQDFRLTIQDNDAPIIGSTALTYSNLLNNQGILASECLRCHNSVLNRGGYDITNYEQMVRKGILRPGDTNNSIMFLRMDADNIVGLDPMPLTGLIDPALRFEVKQWILQGALNN